MADFIRRVTAPTSGDGWYYANNPFYLAGYGMPNCTAYAWGRFWEISGERPKLSTGDAEKWYGHADGYKRGKTPKLGAVICWRTGQVGGNDGPGHVGIVEQINADGSIVTSESGWQDSRFWWTKSRTNADGNWGASSSYVFQGFIYNPIDFEGTGLPDIEPIAGNRYLTQAEMENNATYIWNYLGSRGWSINAVAGMLGNMQTESTINPGLWEGRDEGDTSQGFGLVQWTPATKLINWASNAGLGFAEMSTQLQRIEYELEHGIQYYPTKNYPETFAQYKVSTKDPYYLGMAFLANYERPAVPNQTKRGKQAQAWYEFLSALPAPGATKIKRKALPLWMMLLATRRKV